jgi:hypothetical protein
MQIWRMNIDGSEQTHMVNEEANGWFPHVSPDGKWVVYVAYAVGDVSPADHPANKHVELRLIPSTGGESQTIIKLFGGTGHNQRELMVARQPHRRLCFVSAQTVAYRLTTGGGQVSIPCRSHRGSSSVPFT